MTTGVIRVDRPGRPAYRSGAMNKNALVAEVAKRTGGNRAEVARAIDAAMAVIREAVAGGDRVTLVDFGTFAKIRRNKRLARNPRRPDETYNVPARDVPAFSPGRKFRQEVETKRRRSATRKATPSSARTARRTASSRG
jgi:DNA-binding protein HU-beta